MRHQELPEHIVPRTGSTEFHESGPKHNLSELMAKFDAANWEQCCRTMHVHVMHSHEQAAIDTLMAYLKSRRPPLATIKTSLACVLQVRFANALERCSIRTVEDAIAASDAQLYSIRGFREVTVRKIRETCKAVLRGEVFEVNPEDM